MGPERVFLDTNVYIIGAADPASPEAAVLRWVGFGGTVGPEVVVSSELITQVLRVARRLRGKDWGGLIISKLLALNLVYVHLDAKEVATLADSGRVPREDADMYLTASRGQAQCFISANHVLIRALVEQSGEFECLTPEAFVEKHLK